MGEKLKAERGMGRSGGQRPGTAQCHSVKAEGPGLIWGRESREEGGQPWGYFRLCWAVEEVAFRNLQFRTHWKRGHAEGVCLHPRLAATEVLSPRFCTVWRKEPVGKEILRKTTLPQALQDLDASWLSELFQALVWEYCGHHVGS